MADKLHTVNPGSYMQSSSNYRAKRINLIIASIFCMIIPIMLLAIAILFPRIFNGDWHIPQGLGIYIGLWILLSLLCLFFSYKLSFNAILGKSINLLEIPVYLSFTGLVLIMSLGVAPYLDRKYLIQQVNLSKDIPMGLLLTGIGLVSMWGGYAFIVGTLKNRVISQSNHRVTKINFDEPFFYRAVAIYIFLVMLRLVLYRFPNIYESIPGVLRQPATYAMELSWFFVALFTVQSALKRWPRWIFIMVLVFEPFLIVLSGYSSSLLKLLFLLIASYTYIDKRIPSWLLLIGCLVGFLLTPITRAMRTVNLSPSESLANTISTTAESVWVDNNEGILFTENLFITRQSGTAQLPGLILKLTPSIIPYRPSTELLSIPLSFIPRSIWSNKFESGKAGSDFAIEYLGLSGKSSAATTMGGSAYMFGGWVVLIILMTLAGIVFALTYYYIMVPALKSRQVGLFAMYGGLIIANFHIGEGDISGMWQGLIQRGLVFFFCLLVLCLKRKNI